MKTDTEQKEQTKENSSMPFLRPLVSKDDLWRNGVENGEEEGEG